jgi:5-methyltetrahydrofolate--homocysteine methyltransferase
MKDLLKRLRNGEILVSDGGVGTMLMELGLKPGDPPESFNLTHKDLVEKIAGLYLSAGADIIHTNTFGGSPIRLSFYSLQDKTEEINRNAVMSARNAIKGRAYVSASCGPSGKFLKPHGEVEPEEMYSSFERQIKTLVASGVDIICVETMTDLKEAELAIKAAKAISPTTPLMATMTFDDTPRGFYTMMGVSIKEAAAGLEKFGADIIGSNCGSGIEDMLKTAAEFKKHTDLPLLMQPNAGIPKITGNMPDYPETPEFMKEKYREMISLGVSIIGGCCGTTPEHIKAIRKLVDSLQNQS